MNKIIPHHIDGRNRIVPQRELPIFNPATGLHTASVYCADEKIIAQAVEAGLMAQKSWAKIPPIKKAKIMRDFAQIIEENILKLAQLVTEEHGKTIADAQASIQRGLEILHYHCGIQQHLQGSHSHQVSQNVHTHTIHQPLGVCVGVTPFNFPVMVPMWMMIPAIACGNAFILKPSEKVPTASLQLIEWFEQAGLPPGVAQCLQGDAKTVQGLLEHPEVQAFAAVGSTKVANYIYTEATKRGKRAHTFGGAKNHAVVMPDANLEHAADNIVSSAFGSAGQRCMAISVVVAVGDETASQLIEKMRPKIEKMKIGCGTEPNIDMGPVISLQQRDFLLNCLQQGQEEGAELVIDGRLSVYPSSGYFLGPSLFDKVKETMSVYQNELFGPILVMLRVKNLQEAISLVNSHRYGNGGVIFTQSGAFAQHFADEIECGMVGINVPIPVPIVSHPFGGWKESSFGSQGMHALESIHFYTKQKTITTAWPQAEIKDSSFNMPHH